MNFAELLNPKLIICDLKGQDRESIYLEMLQSLKHSRNKEIGDIQEIFTEISAHEALIEMPYEAGFAIPHTRSVAVQDLHLVMGIHKAGVQLQEHDATPSKIILMFLVSKETSQIYLLMLKALSRYFSSPGMSDKLACCVTPAQVIEIFHRDQVEVNHSIKAEDIMGSIPDSLPETGMLGAAIDSLAQTKRLHIPIVNDKDQLIGDLNIDSILKGSVPDYILMMDHVAFLPEFEPFDKLLKNEDKTSIDKFINREPHTCSLHTPLMEIILKVLKEQINCFYVVDQDKRLLGTITKHELIQNLLRS